MVDARAVRKLYETDPDFAVFAKNVMGARGPDEFLAKMSPDASAVHVPGSGKRLVRRKQPVQKSAFISGLMNVAPNAARTAGKASAGNIHTAPGKSWRFGNWIHRKVKPDSRPPGAPGPAAQKPKPPPKGETTTAGNVAAAGFGVAAGYGGTKVYQQSRAQQDEERYYGGKSVNGDMSFSKVDSDKRQVFGWASITHVNGEPVVDRQGDVVTLEEVEKSAYDYVVKSRVGGSQHKRDGDKPFHAADLIESFVVTEDKAQAMGLGDDVPQGWWVGFKVNDEDTWQKVKNGEVTGFSVHGRGKRQQIAGELTPSEVVDYG